MCVHNGQVALLGDGRLHHIAQILCLLNMSDFSPVEYRILAMLQEWVCQYAVRDVDKLRQRFINKQTVIDQAIDGW